MLPILVLVLPLGLFVGQKALIYFAIAEFILAPLLLRFELHEYLADIGELPESGFRVPDPPGIVHGLRTCLYNLYLEFVVWADVLDFTPLACPQTHPGKFLPENFPTRLTTRPSVIRGLPQRQRNHCLPVDLEGTKEKMIFRWFPQKLSAVRAQPSENEGAGAMGLVSPFCKVLGTDRACIISYNFFHTNCNINIHIFTYNLSECEY